MTRACHLYNAAMRRRDSGSMRQRGSATACLCVSMPMRQRAGAPACRCTNVPVRQYANASVRQCVGKWPTTSTRQYGRNRSNGAYGAFVPSLGIVAKNAAIRLDCSTWTIVRQKTPRLGIFDPLKSANGGPFTRTPPYFPGKHQVKFSPASKIAPRNRNLDSP